MALDATTIKLTESDKQIIAALKAKHGTGSMVEVIRMSLTHTLLTKPAQKKKEKSPWGS